MLYKNKYTAIYLPKFNLLKIFSRRGLQQIIYRHRTNLTRNKAFPETTMRHHHRLYHFDSLDRYWPEEAFLFKSKKRILGRVPLTDLIIDYQCKLIFSGCQIVCTGAGTIRRFGTIILQGNMSRITKHRSL